MNDLRTLRTHSEIAAAVRGLEKERRDAMKRLLHDFDEYYYHPNMQDIHAACEEIGHKWSYTHSGPLGHPWFTCTVCHASKCDVEND